MNDLSLNREALLEIPKVAESATFETSELNLYDRWCFRSEKV